jgi:hypothetical protein
MADLTLDRIRAIGGIVTAKTEQRLIKWTQFDEETGEPIEYDGTVEIRRMAFGWIDRIRKEAERAAAQATTERERQRVHGAVFIAGGVLFGGESMSYADALQLHPALADQLTLAFLSVNKLLKTAADDPDKESATKN